MSLFYFYFFVRSFLNVNPILSTECTMIYTPNHWCCMPYYTPFRVVNERFRYFRCCSGALPNVHHVSETANGERGTWKNLHKTFLASWGSSCYFWILIFPPPRYTYVRHTVSFFLHSLSLVILHKRLEHSSPEAEHQALQRKMINCPR